MTKRKLITIAMGLLVLTLTGCTNQTADNTVQLTDEVDTQRPYEAFVEKIQSENLWDYGIDIVSMLDEHLSQYYASSTGDKFLTADNITDINYVLERCNLSKKDGASFNDMVVGIDIIKDAPLGAGLNSMHVFYAFILNENGQMDTVLDEVVTGRETDLKYELLDVTGDGSDEIILTQVSANPAQNASKTPQKQFLKPETP